MLAVQRKVQSSQVLVERLRQARVQTDKLFAIVKPDSPYDRPIRERHRIVFYIGHLEAFDWNLLRPGILASFDPAMDQLFAFGIDPLDGGLPSDQPSDWPSLEQVRNYTSRTREAVDALLERGGISETLLNTAIEHRLMHAETLAYMLHQLPIEKKIPQPQADVPAREQPRSEIIEIPEGRVRLGLPRNAPDFGWDNEYEAHEVSVPAFAIDRYKVTNGQFLEFMGAGGYQDQSLWTGADWEWKTASNTTHPAFWKRSGDGWHLRTMFNEIHLPRSWPVYVSHAEASAYARWAGKRLPTEAEWQRAAYGSSEQPFPWGDATPGVGARIFRFRRAGTLSPSERVPPGTE